MVPCEGHLPGGQIYTGHGKALREPAGRREASSTPQFEHCSADRECVEQHGRVFGPLLLPHLTSPGTILLGNTVIPVRNKLFGVDVCGLHPLCLLTAWNSAADTWSGK